MRWGLLLVLLAAGCRTPPPPPPVQHAIMSRGEVEKLNTEIKIVQGFANSGSMCGFIVRKGETVKVDIRVVDEQGVVRSYSTSEVYPNAVYGCPTAVVQ